METIIGKIKKLNEKNKKRDGYSLGDVLLLGKWERELMAAGLTKKEVEALSPSFYRHPPQ